VLARTLERLATVDCEAIIVALAPDDIRYDDAIGARGGVLPLRCGGATRAATVRKALQAIAPRVADDDWILVHDAARPCVPRDALDRLVGELRNDSVGGLLALPLGDTLKRADAMDELPRVMRTESREGLWLAQTPQMFRHRLLAAAHGLDVAGHCTDEAQAIEALAATGVCDMHVPRRSRARRGDSRNAGGVMSVRIGNGFDVHAFASGRPLIIGGVTIAHDRGLAGHSDADVLLHAIADAILGALAQGDLGRHFPDSDPRWKGADSRRILRDVAAMMSAQRHSIANVDATVVAQAPKLAPFVDAMRANIANDLGCDVSRVSVKATTTERLGFAGREEGIAALATVLLAAMDDQSGG
jgi:2-C-methyl-D-erythritol 2,4-cyclodiphosphate synthase/2-C-methyl-D-erythritol 4-phosphate cytidylyltransferase